MVAGRDQEKEEKLHKFIVEYAKNKYNSEKYVLMYVIEMVATQNLPKTITNTSYPPRKILKFPKIPKC